MKKEMKRLSQLMVRLFSLMAVMAVSAFAASAADPKDLGELQLGVEYTLPKSTATVGTLTTPQAGTLTIAGPMYVSVFTDQARTDELPLSFVGYGPYTQSCEVEANHTYYIYNSEFGYGETMKLTMAGVGEDPLKIEMCYPAENSYYNLSSDDASQLQLQFNHAITLDSSWMLTFTAPDGSAASRSYSGATYGGKFVQVPLQAKLLTLLRNNEIKADSEFKVILNNLKTASGLELEDHLAAPGMTVFNFKIGTLPTTMTSSTIPSTFLSYWIEGDEAANFEAVFDGPILNNPNTKLYIQYGDVEVDNGYYQESVPFTIEGNTIKANLSGKLRTPATMLPVLGTIKSNIGIRLQNVLDERGNPVASPGSGTVGSYDWYPTYKILDRANVACEFTPANGGSIKNKTEIELWLNGLNTLSFSGFKFEREGAATVVVAKEDAEFEKGDTSDEGVYIITIPETMRNQKGVRVALADLKAADGYDHENDVKAIYDSFAVMFATPANGSEMEYLHNGDIITIETNCADANPGMCVVYDIEDLNPEDPMEAMLKSQSYMTRQANGTYTSEVFGDYKMVLGHDYKVTFTAWATEDDKNYREEPLGSDFIIWSGLTLPYQYSPIQFVSIDPSTDTKISKDDREFTVKFDGYVTLKPTSTFINRGMGMNQAFESIVAVNPQTDDDGVDYSDEWVLTVPASYMAELTAALDISIKAFDQDGLIVKGTEGTEENTYFYFSYDTASRYEAVEVYLPENETAPASVAQIWVHNDKGVLPSYTMPANSCYVMTKSREIVAYVKDFIIPLNDLPIEEVGDQLNTEVGLVLDTEINTSGAYILYAPVNYFSIGTEFAPYCSEELYWNFNVYAETGDELPHAMDIVPAPGNVENLNTIEIVFTDEDEIAIGNGMITLYKEDEQLSRHDADLDWDIWNKAIVDLGTTHTASGTYKLDFPAGYFVLGSMGDRESAPFALEYKVGDTGIESITITTSAGKVYDLNGVVRNGDELPAGIYIIDGKKVMVK